ncbi:ESPR-type extended signal peptide-containing protein [Burkholderia cenocepacia]|uniref:ESPR-type extended signal peptide-containing protein n=1 Tax=Burkholderia cenocepacia TaxID=95486 RepID=UPI002AB19CEF|nr:ESPR-type extended signal peptide-containing protein [Burkholderia cenocepacia]
MNKTYRSIWNAVTNTWTAAAETAKSHSKGSSRAARQAVIAIALGGAAIGGAAAAEACDTTDGMSGIVDSNGVCQASADSTNVAKARSAMSTTGTIGITAVDGSNIGQFFDAQGGGGSNASASQTGDIAIGTSSRANSGTGAVDHAAVAVGFGAQAQAARTVALGMYSSASAADALAFGYKSTAGGAGSVAIGETAVVTNGASNAIAFGANAHAANSNTTAIGAASSAASGNSVALGQASTANNSGSISIGSNATASANYGVALGGATVGGRGAIVTGTGSVAIGTISNASAANAVALGMGSVADRDNTVSVGAGVPNIDGATFTRQIVNVGAGTQANDAVNVSQLEPAVTALGGGAKIDPSTGAVTGPTYNLANGGTQTTVGGALGALDGALTTANGNIKKNADDITDINKQLGDLSSGTIRLVQQASAGNDITVGANTDGAAVNFKGLAGDRKLTGVAAGEVSTASTDAINGAQLHGVSTSVASAIGAGSTVNPDGSITAPSFSVGDGSGGTTIVHSVGDVVTNLDGRVTKNEGAISDLADQIGSGTLGLVQQAGANDAITVGAATGGTSVNFAGTSGARTLSGVANGVKDDDVVTIAQLKATGLIDYTGKEIGAVTYDGIGLDTVTFGGTGGTTLSNVKAGVADMDAVNMSQLNSLQQEFAQKYGDLSGRVGDLEAGGTGGGSGGGAGGGVGTGTGGPGSIVVGDGSDASGSNSSAIGQGSVASGNNGTAVGQGAVASGSNGTAIGQGAVASGGNGTAIGQNANASGNNSVALGAGSVADRDNAVSVGSAGNERQITNVAAGTAPTDAVNLQQMNNAIGSTRQDAMGGVAAAMAVAGLPQSTQPGRTFVSMAGSTYGGEYGSAMGLSYMTRDGKWTVKAAVNTSSRGEVGGVIGGGFYW